MAKSKSTISELAGVAVQLVYEYEDFGDEHVSDMMRTYTDCGERPGFTGDELQGACYHAQKAKAEGKDWDAAIKYVKEQLK